MIRRIGIAIAFVAIIAASGIVLFYLGKSDVEVKYGYLRTALIDSLSNIAITENTWPVEVAVAPSAFVTGRETVEALIGGQLDFATMAEFPFLLASRRDPSLRIVAVITSAYSLAIVGRKSAGITAEPFSLKGKRVGATNGTTGQFMLESFLQSNNLERGDYKQIPLNPPNLLAALITGDLDAIATWEPHVQKAIDTLSQDAVVVDGSRKFFKVKYLLVAKENYINEHAGEVVSVLQGLIDAEQLMRSEKDKALTIIEKETFLTRSEIDVILENFDFHVVLDTELVDALSYQQSWAMDRDLVPRTSPVNWSKFITTVPLQEVSADRVKLND